jgi:putative intracellular protease/amidase
MRVLFALTNNFWDDDFLNLYKLFDSNGFEVKVATYKGYSVYGVKGTKVAPDYSFQDLVPFKTLPDLLVMISYLDINSFNVTEFKEFANTMLQNRKLVAVRTAPIFLAQEKLIKGKKTTWDYINFPQYEDYLADWGAFPVKADMYVDGNYISSRGCCYETLFNLISLSLKGLID